MKNSNYRAVLFDYDGVILDSLEDHVRSWNEILAPYGVQVPSREIALLEGQSYFDIARQICQKYDLDVSRSERIASAKNKVYLSSDAFKFYEKVYEIIDEVLAAELKIALVTGAHKDRLLQSLPSDLRQKFHCIVTADDVVHKKPDPEPFLNAANLLEVEAGGCLVVENAPLGIEAAKRAGMHCIAITTTLPADKLRRADVIIDDLAQLLKFIR